MVKRVIISGYYGFGNTGDEAVLSGIYATLNELIADVEITALSSDPERTLQEHPGIKAVNRNKLGAIISSIRNADLFISGGGSLFQDATSAYSPYYYLFVLRLAQILGRKTMVYAQGVGPLQRSAIRKAVAKAFNKTALITVRDEDSKTLLQETGVTRDIQVCTDPSFMVEPDMEAADKIISEAGFAGHDIIGVSLRNWVDSDEWLNQALSTIARISKELDAKIVLIPMQESEDKVDAQSAAILRCGGNPRIAKGIIARCEMVIGMRLHSLIFAASVGVPFIPIVYDPKVAAFAAKMGFTNRVNVGDSMGVLENAIRSAWCEHKTTARKLVDEIVDLRDQALKPGNLAAELIEY